MATAATTAHAVPAERWWTPADANLRRLWWHAWPQARRLASHGVQRQAATMAPWWSSGAEPCRSEAELAQQLTALREACRRAAARGEPVLEAQAQAQALPWLATLCHRALGHRPTADELEAAWRMNRGQALTLRDGAARSRALALAAIVASWSGRPCHVVTATETTAQACALALRPLYEACGVSVACVATDTAPAELMAGYRADVVYATARRLITDHYRDLRLRSGIDARLRWALRQLTVGPSRLLTRGLYTALIDDMDLVLGDEALFPVVLSVADESIHLPQAAQAACAFAATLDDQDWRTGAQDALELTPQGQERLEAFAGSLPPMWRALERSQSLVIQALFVRHRLQRGVHYQLREQGVEFSGDRFLERLPPGLDWFGLSQAIEACEGRTPSPPPRTVERTSVQSFFNRYHRLGGAAPCLDGMEAELWATYRLLVQPDATRVPRPAQQQLWADDSVSPQTLLEPVLSAALERGHAVLLVVRRKAHAQRWEAWQAHEAFAVAVGASDLSLALARLARVRGRPGATLVLQEPLNTARSERALACRFMTAVDAPVTIVRMASAGDALLQEHFQPAQALSRLLGRPLRKLQPLLTAAAQTLADRRLRHRRQTQARREAQVLQQLSFSGVSRLSTTSLVAGSPSPPSATTTR